MSDLGSAGTWVLERSHDGKFPYRLQIVGREGRARVLRTQDRWPTANRNIYCLREDQPPAASELQGVERVPILAL